jgi:hypothetical protein
MTMAIYRMLQNRPLSPEDINLLATAYEATLKALGLADRSDPITELVARKIIEIGQTGVRDPLQISKLAVMDLGAAPDVSAERVAPVTDFLTSNSARG